MEQQEPLEKPVAPPREIRIVFREQTFNGPWQVRLEGDVDRIGKTHDEHLSPCEKWAGYAWLNVQRFLISAGVIKMAPRAGEELAPPAPPQPTLVIP